MKNQNVIVIKLDSKPSTNVINQTKWLQKDKTMDISWLDVQWLSASSIMGLFCF